MNPEQFIVCPYVFKNDIGGAITVNHEHYRLMNTNCFWHEMEDLDTNNMFVMQDSAICHRSQATFNIMHERFAGTLRRGEVNWPQTLCNLPTSDFFLHSFLKQQIWAIKLQTPVLLKANIIHVIVRIQTDLYARTRRPLHMVTWSLKAFNKS